MSTPDPKLRAGLERLLDVGTPVLFELSTRSKLGIVGLVARAGGLTPPSIAQMTGQPLVVTLYRVYALESSGVLEPDGRHLGRYRVSDRIGVPLAATIAAAPPRLLSALAHEPARRILRLLVAAPAMPEHIRALTTRADLELTYRWCIHLADAGAIEVRGVGDARSLGRFDVMLSRAPELDRLLGALADAC